MKCISCIAFLTVSVIADIPDLNIKLRPSNLDFITSYFQSTRIVGGSDSVPHSRPYQVGILIGFDTGRAFCGGSLISRNFVMTAAHCSDDGTNKAKNYTVILGAHNVFGDNDTVKINTTEAYVHPAWNPGNLQNDICLLRLPMEVTLNDRIQLSKLPSRSAVVESFEAYQGLVSGWGKTSDRATTISPTLKEITVNVVANWKCNFKYLGLIQYTNICTKMSTCSGDSGGPLVLKYKGETIQVGIVSFGIIFGCQWGWPVAYTRVTSYLDWISTVTGIAIEP